MELPKIMGSMVTLKVTPEVLVSKADEVLKDVNAIKIAMDTTQQKVEGTHAYWIGEAGDLHRKLYNDQKESIDEMMRRLAEHPRDLKIIANNYTTTEREVESMANALTDNVII